MKSDTFRAFGDELTKIAFFKRLSQGFGNAMRTGWHGYGPDGSITRQNWRGMGRAPAAELEKMGPVSRAVDKVTSLGGATKYLPVGAKSMMLMGTLAQANGALKEQDQAGLERSRTERMAGLTANTMGSLAGAGAALKAMPNHPIIASMVGGIGGGMLGEKVVTAPWRNKRKQEYQAQMAHQHDGSSQASPYAEPTYPTGAAGRIVDGLGGGQA